MAVAGTLEIQMLANMARLQTDMNQAKGVVTGFAQHAQNAMAGVRSAFASLGIGLGFAAVAAGFKGIIDAAARLDDVAERTGATVEQLSKLEQVARIGGHSMETAEMSMIRLAKALHGGDDEAKGAGKALAALGLQADALRGKDTAESLRIVAAELNKYQDGAGKTALAIDLLGKSGAQALPFLKDLANEQGIATRVTTEQAAAAEELQKSLGRLRNDMQAASQAMALKLVPSLVDWVSANREALRIGGSTSEMLRLFVFNLEAMTTEKPGEQIRRLTGELEKLKGVMAGPWWKQSGFEFFGGEQSIKDKEKQIEFLKFLQRQEALAIPGGDSRGETQRFGLPGAKIPLNYTGADNTALKDAQKKIDDLKRLHAEIVALGQSIDVAVMPLTKAQLDTANLDQTKRDLDSIKKTLDEGRKGWIAYADAVFAEADAQNLANAPAKSFTQVSEEITDRVLTLVDPMYALKKANDELTKSFADGSLRISQEQLALAKLHPEVRALLQSESSIFDKIQRDFEAGNLTVEQMQRAQQLAMEKTQNSLDKTDDIARRLGMTFESTFESLIFGAKGSVQPLKLLESALLDIGKAWFRINVTEPAAKQIGGMGGGFGGILSALGIGGSAPLVGEMVPGQFSLMNPAYGHSGGIVGALGPLRAVDASVFDAARRFHAGGMPGLMSNEVPVIAKRDEGIFTPAQMRALAPVRESEPAVNITQHIQVDSRSDIASVRAAMATAKNEAVKEVANLVRRRGSYAKAIRG